MRVLTIETSTPLEDVAVVENGVVLAERRARAGRGHAEELVGAVSSVLGESNTELAAVGAIGVSIGPGRFTGLRVGLATAKGLAAASGVTVRPVPTLEALARSVGAASGLVCAALDARRGEVYAALFRLGGRAERLTADLAVAPVALVDRVRALARGEPVVFVGTGAAVYASEIRDLMERSAVFPSEEIPAPRALAVAAMVEEAAGEEPPDLNALEPVYLRGIQDVS